jgi:alkanesulfonate monooxygenase SsuD/methylene tetrahydromethanopterin reductase-like flavin-dependent oxidoreductase (luciferase family)
VRVGLVHSNNGVYVDRDIAIRIATIAEELGFDSLLSWDHFMLPWSNRTFDVWSLLSFLAAKTEKIKLGTCVTPLPFRHPAVLAKIVSSVDFLSNGRVTLGVGAGWHKPEFDGYSQWDDDEIRVAKTREALEIIHALWTRGRLSYEGKYYDIDDAVLDPKPAQNIPMWFGVQGRTMLSLAAKYGAGWIPVMISPRQYARLREKLEDELKVNRRADGFVYALFQYVESDLSKTRKVLEEYEKSGCRYFSLGYTRNTSGFVAWLEKFGKDLVSSYA